MPRKGKRLPPAAPPAILRDQPTFDLALDALVLLDPAFAVSVFGDRARPALRRRTSGFEGLAWIIVSQQVSTASADAIFARVKAHLGTVEAATIHATSDANLKACGLSGPKIRTLRALTAAAMGGTLDFAALATQDAEAAHAALVAIKGVGPWTAGVFLLFSLGHADAWPAGDLALQEAARLALGLPERPDTKALTALGERWRPLRGVAAHCLWAYYRSARGRPATLEQPRAP